MRKGVRKAKPLPSESWLWLHTVCLERNWIWPSVSPRTRSGRRLPPLIPKGSPLLYFNEMSPRPQEHRRKSLIRDTYATPLEPVKQVPEELSVYFPQWQKQHILISYGVLNPTSLTNTSWQVIVRYFPDGPWHRILPSNPSLKGTRRKAELANRFPPHTVPSGVSARHT